MKLASVPGPRTLLVCVIVASVIAAVLSPAISASVPPAVASPRKIALSIPSVSAAARSRVSADSSPGIRAASSIEKSSRTAFRFGFISLTPMTQAASEAASVERGPLRRAGARRGHGIGRGADRNAFHRDAEARGGRAGEQPVEPTARRGHRVHVSRGAGFDAGRALFGRRKQFEREAIASDAKRGVEFRRGAVRAALFDCGRDVRAEFHLGAQFGPLAGLGIAFRLAGSLAGGALFGLLGFDRDRGGANLALKISGAALDRIKLGAMFVGKRIDAR